MSGGVADMPPDDTTQRRPGQVPPVGRGPLFGGRVLVAGLIATGMMIVAPLRVILFSAFSAGLAVYVRSLTEPSTLHAVWLTCLTALVVVPITILFGIAA